MGIDVAITESYNAQNQNLSQFNVSFPVKTLDLRFNRLHSLTFDPDCAKHLQVLEIDGNRLPVHFVQNLPMKYLSMRNNQVTTLKPLLESKSLQRLIVSQNLINDKALMECIDVEHNLEQLHISYNQITDEGIPALLKIIQNTKKISIMNNRITINGLELFMRSTVSRVNIEELVVGNHYTREYGKEQDEIIADFIRQNNSVLTMVVFGYSSISKFIEALRYNTVLKELTLLSPLEDCDTTFDMEQLYLNQTVCLRIDSLNFKGFNKRNAKLAKKFDKQLRNALRLRLRLKFIRKELWYALLVNQLDLFGDQAGIIVKYIQNGIDTSVEFDAHRIRRQAVINHKTF